MITKEQLLKIREYISCPQFGDKTYGIWGALSVEQRETFLQLIETVEFLKDAIKKQQAEIGKFKKKITYLRDINKRTDAHLHVQLVEHSKSEAYREFAERVKAYFVNDEMPVSSWLIKKQIDNTLKEFLEGLKND